jgi:hypothetical protein
MSSAALIIGLIDFQPTIYFWVKIIDSEQVWDGRNRTEMYFRLVYGCVC